MRIVFILVGYYPKFTAVGNCVSKLAHQMSENNEIIIITNKNIVEQRDIEIWNNQKIKRISTRRLNMQLILNEKIKTAGFKKNIYKGLLIFHKMFWNLIQMSNKYGLDINLTNAYYKELKGLEGKIDAVIPCCMPWEAVYASAKFADEYKVALCPLLFDPYSENRIFFRNKIIRKLKSVNSFILESKIFTQSNHIFFTDNWDSYFMKNKIHKADITRIEHPLIEKMYYPIKPLHNKKRINFIYQGELNFEMRLPNKTLKFFELMQNYYKDFKLHFFAFGNAAFFVEKFSKEHPNILEYYGHVEKNIANMYLMDEDISLIIGNNNPNIVPSKIFECISLGKPIIYFYNNENDKPLKILKKYPLLIYIKQGDYSIKTIDRVINWLTSVCGMVVSFEAIKSLYKEATPSFVNKKIKQVLSVIENQNGKY